MRPSDIIATDGSNCDSDILYKAVISPNF